MEMRESYADDLAQAVRSVQVGRVGEQDGRDGSGHESGVEQRAGVATTATDESVVDGGDGQGPDVKAIYEERAIRALELDVDMVNKIKQGQAHWSWVMMRLREELPPTLEDRNNIAYQLVRKAVDRIMGGPQDEAWHTEKDAAARRNRIKPGPK